MVYEVKDKNQAKKLFDGWQETMIMSCLQGVMGRLYGDSEYDPESVMASLGDFCFFAGEPSRELILYKSAWGLPDFVIMTANSDEWFECIESVYKDRARKVSRFAMKKEPDVFNKEKLTSFVNSLSADYRLQMIDRELFSRLGKQEWSRSFVAQHKNYDEYSKIGLGVVAVKDGEAVSGASSYSTYKGGIEIEISTREDFRRLGLATACGAKLILECLNRGLYPSWDAQNRQSVALAEKLGYHFDHEYTAYEIIGC